MKETLGTAKIENGFQKYPVPLLKKGQAVVEKNVPITILAISDFVE